MQAERYSKVISKSFVKISQSTKNPGVSYKHLKHDRFDDAANLGNSFAENIQNTSF